MLYVSSAPEPVFADRVRLPLRFDVARMRAEVEALTADAWVRHYVPANFEGEWDVLPLRSPAGATHPIQQIYSDPCATEYVDGPLLSRAPYIREVIASFACPLRAVRLMRLTPGSRIKEHSDHDLGAEYGKARIHVPVTTNPDVVFEVNRRPVEMAPGETWYLRLSDPHRVANDGTSDRVHLVIDAILDDWLEAQLRAGSES